MVDVAPKPATHRVAVAKARVVMAPEVAAAVADQAVGKGDVLGVARVAGIQAAKRTSELIPLCHAIAISSVAVDFALRADSVEITTKVETVDRTGVEMEALSAATVAALTIYDMCKALDRSMTIEGVCLLEKTGGRSGAYRRDERNAAGSPTPQAKRTTAPGNTAPGNTARSTTA